MGRCACAHADEGFSALRQISSGTALSLSLKASRQASATSSGATEPWPPAAGEAKLGWGSVSTRPCPPPCAHRQTTTRPPTHPPARPPTLLVGALGHRRPRHVACGHVHHAHAALAQRLVRGLAEATQRRLACSVRGMAGAWGEEAREAEGGQGRPARCATAAAAHDQPPPFPLTSVHRLHVADADDPALALWRRRTPHKGTRRT